jgi:1,2-diacylglycerol 3-alpha-glucosyltransferase
VRIGVCSYWFNRGQAIVGRQLRSALEAMGHETFVLARPNRPTSPRPDVIDRGDVWDQPGVTAASAWEIPAGDYLDWAAATGVEIAFFDQNYGFEGIAALRRSGVRTVGRFVWEQFAPEHVGPATEAFDVNYSLTACERERYAEMGISSPRVHWGIHPELLEYAKDSEDIQGGANVTYFYPAGFLTKRKPVREVLDAFKQVTDPNLRLVIKGQVERKQKLLDKAVRKDPRVDVILEDLPTDEHLRLFSSADVCLAPSRWEGLGLHLYEATAFGMPTITNDNPPMNEVIRDGANGVLVPGIPAGEAKSGIPAFDPDVRQLADAIERLADPDERHGLELGAREMREELRWERTVEGYRELIESVS